MDSSCTIFVVEEHDQVLDLWRAQQSRSLSVLHLDAHCDMRGLLIDRQIQHAYRIWDRNLSVDQGNFLTHAILEGRINSLRWVYNDLGGRQNDVGTVKYESDLTSIPYRWLLALRGERGIAIHYEVIPEKSWSGLAEGELLDIDWDFFAHIAYPESAIQDHVESFLSVEFHVIPEQVYICYSPDFSQPSRIQYQNFVTALAKIFKAEIIPVHRDGYKAAIQSAYNKYLPHRIFRLIRHFYYQANLSLRKRGIY